MCQCVSWLRRNVRITVNCWPLQAELTFMFVCVCSESDWCGVVQAQDIYTSSPRPGLQHSLLILSLNGTRAHRGTHVTHTGARHWVGAFRKVSAFKAGIRTNTHQDKWIIFEVDNFFRMEHEADDWPGPSSPWPRPRSHPRVSVRCHQGPGVSCQ